MSTRQESIDLLNNIHQFPCPVMVKAIGQNVNDFPQRVVSLVRITLELDFDPAFTSRETRGGRHVAVTLEPTFDDAEQVLKLYAALRQLDDVTLIM